MYKVIKLLLKVFPRPLLIRLSGLFNGIIAFFLKGKNVECPVCGGHFKKFLPYGYVDKRENALCPKCLSLERHRLLWLFLQEKELLTKELKVLHIAPEQPFIKRFRKNKNWNYTTGDLLSPLADVKFDVQNIPFEDESFDLVICNHVLEHVDEDSKAMSEFHRILKKGGNAVLQVPMNINSETTDEDPSITDPKEREKRFGQYDHVRMYGMDYFERLRKVGFKIVDSDIYFVKNLPEDKKSLYRIPEYELVPYVEK